MDAMEFFSPREHLVIDDFFSSPDLAVIWSEIMRLESQFKVGLQNSNYRQVKKNRNLVVHADTKVRGRQNKLFSITTSAIHSAQMLERLESAKSPFYRFLKFCKSESLHLSSYQDGHAYGRHVDINEPSNITIVIFICKEPRAFRGGNFELEFGGKKKTVRFKNNRLLMFPSNTPHRVTPVRLDDRSFENARISLQAWPLLNLNLLRSSAFKDHYGKDRTDSYVTPRFGIAKDSWNEVSVALRRHATDEIRPQELLVALSRPLQRLLSNAEYLGVSLFSDQKTVTRALVDTSFPKSEPLLAVAQCAFLRRGLRFCFGYTLRHVEGRAELHFFVRLKRRSKVIYEGTKAVSPFSSFATVKALLHRFFEMARATEEDVVLPRP
jgi:Rps23 Pro-64 3,4-dihydroxylase Tpa1-like proline 4-hydroxylase